MKRPTLVLLCLSLAGVLSADDVINDDLAVLGSLTLGFDATPGQSFGFDTLILNENNLRILFRDTSGAASFPSTDWRLVCNDANDGGANYFVIENATAGRQLLRLDASARTNAVFANATGVGLGTDAPQTDLHIASGNMPTIRLDQDGTGGIIRQSWELGGNERSFSLKNVTAATTPLVVDDMGHLGLGTATPAVDLHLVNGGAPAIRFERDAAGTAQSWELVGDDASFRLQNITLGGPADLTVDPMGNLNVRGNVTALNIMVPSDRNLKHAIEPVTGALVLARIRELPVSTWAFREDAQGIRHLGPMAQDFHAAFGLGVDDRHVSPLDLAGVAVAGVQELEEQLRQKDARIDELQERLDVLEALVQDLAARE